jgi:hypothetical protein
VAFQAKSAVALIGTLVVVYIPYFGLVGFILASTSQDVADVAYKPLLILATVPVAVVAAVSHILLALLSPKEANQLDERDRLISQRGDQISAYVLGVGVFAAIVLAMFELRSFYVVNALMLFWVAAELAGQAGRLALYRRGV